MVTGPEDATGSRWAERHREAAVTANCHTEKILGPVLKKLALEGEWRAQLAQGAAQVAETEFDPGKIRSHFREILSTAKGFSI